LQARNRRHRLPPHHSPVTIHAPATTSPASIIPTTNNLPHFIINPSFFLFARLSGLPEKRGKYAGNAAMNG
jgi:hypothetical protein